MKKALIFALSLMMLVVFAVGCSSNEPAADTATEAPAAEATAEVVDEATEEPAADEATEEPAEAPTAG